MADLYGRFEFKKRPSASWWTFYDSEAAWMFTWREGSAGVLFRRGGFGSDGRTIAIIPADPGMWSEEGLRETLERWYDTDAHRYRDGAS